MFATANIANVMEYNREAEAVQVDSGKGIARCLARQETVGVFKHVLDVTWTVIAEKRFGAANLFPNRRQVIANVVYRAKKASPSGSPRLAPKRFRHAVLIRLFGPRCTDTHGNHSFTLTNWLNPTSPLKRVNGHLPVTNRPIHGGAPSSRKIQPPTVANIPQVSTGRGSAARSRRICQALMQARCGIIHRRNFPQCRPRRHSRERVRSDRQAASVTTQVVACQSLLTDALNKLLPPGPSPKSPTLL